MIDLLKNKSAKEKANIKGREIAKVDFRGEHTRGNIKIDIQSIEAIEGGVQVFARAWKNGKQLGFGKDGSVDIERFRIFNPPTLVDDENGDIVQRWDGKDADGKKVKRQRTLKEDPEEAVLQVIEHNLSVMKNVHLDSKIKRGKTGNTTSTFYPESGDKFLGAANSVFATARDAATASDSNSAATEGYTICRTTGSFLIRRTFQNYDTAAIDDGDTIDSAVASIYIFGNNSPSGKEHSVYGSTAADTITTADYDQAGTTAFSDTPLDDGTVTTSAYNSQTFNATGIAAINKSGLTKLVWRQKTNDADNVAPSGAGFLNFYNSAESGTTKDPKLVIEHEAAAAFTPRVMIF